MKQNESPYCKCLYYSSNALARIMTRMAEDSFAPVGLSPSYAFLLMSVNKNPGILSGELAEQMMLTPSTVTRLLEKLEEKNLVRRIPEGRNTLVFPTRDSVAMNDRIMQCWQGLYKKIVAELGMEESSRITADIYQAALKLSGQ
jgi:DNA-binding MarR family transcriptional regulator